MSPKEAEFQMVKTWQSNNDEFLREIWSEVCVEPTCTIMDREFQYCLIRKVESKDESTLEKVKSNAEQWGFFSAGVSVSVKLSGKEFEETITICNDDNKLIGFACIVVMDDFDELEANLGDTSSQRILTNLRTGCVAVYIRYLFITKEMRSRSVAHFAVDEIFNYVHQKKPDEASVLGYVHVVKPPKDYHTAKKFWEEHQGFSEWQDCADNGGLLIGVKLMQYFQPILK